MMKCFFRLWICLFGLTANAAIQSGIYQTECQTGRKKTQIYNQDHVVLLEEFYQDKNCTQPLLRFKTSGSVSYDSQNPSFIDFIYDEVSLTLSNDSMISDFNNRQVCQLSDWKNGQEQVVTGLTCDLFGQGSRVKVPSDGDRKFGIYQIKNSRLYYGKMTMQNDGSAFEKRPQEIDESISFKLVE